MPRTPSGALPEVAAISSANLEPTHRPVRILVLAPMADTRLFGSEISLLGLLERLDRDRFRPFAVTVFDGELRRAIEERRVPCRSLFSEDQDTGGRRRRFQAFRYLLAQPRLYRLLLRLRPDLIYAHWTLAPLLATMPAWLARIPLVYSPRSSLLDLPRRDRLAIAACARLGRLALVPNSRAVEASCPGRGAIPCRTVYAGVDALAFERAAPSQALRVGLGALPGEPLAAVVGRIAPAKGQIDFVRAAALVAAGMPRVRFAIVGGPGRADYFEQVRDEVRRLGMTERISITDYIEETASLFRSLDLVCIPSRCEEALGRTAIEAAAAGVAVVASRTGGLSEAVLDGESGLLVPRNDVAALAAAVTRLLRDPELRARFGAAGRRLVRERFGLDRYAREIERVFSDVLTSAGRPVP